MPLTPLVKNRGPLLISKIRGGVDDFPTEFISAIGKDIYVQEVPVDVEPEDLSDFLLASQVTQERTNERKRTSTYFGNTGPGENGTGKTIEDILGITLISELVLPDGQIGTRTRNLVREGSHLTADSLTVDGVQRNLGNGWLDQIITVKPTVFPRNTYRRTRPDVVIPLEFRALLEDQESGFISAGIAAMPTLGIGDIEKTDSQLDEFTHQQTTRSRTGLVLPKFLTGSVTNRFKQVEAITKILELDTTPATPPTALMDVTFTKLGDGTAIEERHVVPSLFPSTVSSIEIPDLVPELFRGSLPIYTEETTVTGTIVDPPILSTGDFEKTETQLDVFNKRVRTRGRAGLAFPATATIHKIGGFQFGGELMKVILTLDSSPLTVESGLVVTESEVKPIGGGLYLRTTEKLDTATEWPELEGTEVDPRTGIIVDIKRKVVAAGTLGGIGVDGYVDVRPIDKWRSIQITSKLDPTSLPSVTTWETTVEHAFPNTLLGLTFLWAAATAPNNYDFDSALLLDMTQGYSGPCRALVTESYSNGPPGGAVSVTTFFPQGHMIGYSWAFAADPSGDGSGVGIARAAARNFSVPPSLHAALTIGGGVIITGGAISGTLPATTPTALPSSGTLITKDVNVERWRFGIFFRRMTQIYIP